MFNKNAGGYLYCHHYLAIELILLIGALCVQRVITPNVFKAVIFGEADLRSFLLGTSR